MAESVTARKPSGVQVLARPAPICTPRRGHQNDAAPPLACHVMQTATRLLSTIPSPPTPLHPAPPTHPPTASTNSLNSPPPSTPASSSPCASMNYTWGGWGPGGGAGAGGLGGGAGRKGPGAGRKGPGAGHDSSCLPACHAASRPGSSSLHHPLPALSSLRCAAPPCLDAHAALQRLARTAQLVKRILQHLVVVVVCVCVCVCVCVGGGGRGGGVSVWPRRCRTARPLPRLLL